MADLGGVAKKNSIINEHKANKDHACCSCPGTIKKGERYQRTTFKTDGDHWRDQKTCMACAAASRNVRVVFIGLKLREPCGPAYKIVGAAMAAVEGCFEAWGIKDPGAALKRLREERNEIMKAWQAADQELRELKRKFRAP